MEERVHEGTWITHDNYARPFKVVLELLRGVPHVTIYHGEDTNYDHMVASLLQIDRLFVGKSVVNKMTLWSMGIGPEFDGNSILICVDEATRRYVYVGDCVMEFTAPEVIEWYVSPVGNNRVPYPVALGENYCIFFISNHVGSLDYIARDEFPDDVDWTDCYHVYYGDWDDEVGEWVRGPSKIQRIHDITVIKARDW
jgi:hypothetical protein